MSRQYTSPIPQRPNRIQQRVKFVGMMGVIVINIGTVIGTLALKAAIGAREL